jgi:hypothetical protein
MPHLETPLVSGVKDMGDAALLAWAGLLCVGG